MNTNSSRIFAVVYVGISAQFFSEVALKHFMEISTETKKGLNLLAIIVLCHLAPQPPSLIKVPPLPLPLLRWTEHSISLKVLNKHVSFNSDIANAMHSTISCK